MLHFPVPKTYPEFIADAEAIGSRLEPLVYVARVEIDPTQIQAPPHYLQTQHIELPWDHLRKSKSPRRGAKSPRTHTKAADITRANAGAASPQRQAKAPGLTPQAPEIDSKARTPYEIVQEQKRLKALELRKKLGTSTSNSRRSSILFPSSPTPKTMATSSPEHKQTSARSWYQHNGPMGAFPSQRYLSGGAGAAPPRPSALSPKLSPRPSIMGYAAMRDTLHTPKADGREQMLRIEEAAS
jgi:hypothetical protein